MQPHFFKVKRSVVGTIGTGTARAARRGRGPSMIGMIPLPNERFTITGITKDETGAASGGFTVYLFDMTSGNPVLVNTTISDANGVYSFSVGSGIRYWIVDYRSGSPDKTGATLNTLTGV